jgi:hypothetical protein
MVDIQAYLNTIYFIIAEISSLDTISSISSSSSDPLLHEQLDLLLTSYPYLHELIQSPPTPSSLSSDEPTPDAAPGAVSPEVFAHLLIYEYKFFKFLCNFNLEAKEYSKALLYFHQLYDLWVNTILPQPHYLSIVLSIEETNMNPLYNPYREMQEDLDYHAFYSCNISYYDHLQYHHQQVQVQPQQSQQQGRGDGFDDVVFDEIVPINEIEQKLLQEIYERFPKNLTARIQSGREAIELSIHFFDLVVLPLSSAPHRLTGNPSLDLAIS